ncbi:MAG TPA: polysaccharide deacetylase family protein [Rhizomicrobium sp.]|jgi:uncharacterized protein YdaL
MLRLLRGLAIAFALIVPAVAQAAPAQTALVIYTHSTTDAYGNAGRLYAIFLRNLIGRYPVAVTIKSAEDCTPAEAKAADAVFVIGFTRAQRIPRELLRAIAARDGTTVWFRYGVDQYLDRTRDLGVSYSGIREFDGNTHFFFDTIRYKGFQFVKYQGDDAEPAMGVLKIADPRRAQTVATISDAHTGEQAPYVIHSGAFWYVADLPFSFTSARDRYLVTADLLTDMLGEPPPPDDHPALVRLEDVHPLTQPQAIDRLSAYFAQRKIPFSIALIPHYLDPFGRSWGGVHQDVTLADPRAAGLVAALKRAVERGGSIVQHGTTHQYGLVRNTNSAVSGDDFEFWNRTDMRPFPALENEGVVMDRVSQGRALILHAGLVPFAFEVPHYEASPVAYRAIARIYPVSYQEVSYYSDDRGRLGTGDAAPEAWNTQYFPYVIRRDYYGEAVIPENLGDLQYAAPQETADDILRNADYAKSVRGGYASFFFHPFFLEGPDADRAMRDLDKIVTGIQKRGFHFVAADKIARDLQH